MAERIRLVRELAREKRPLVKDDVDDAELLCMFVEGHPRALRASWLSFAPLVHRLLKRTLGPEDDVRDLAHLVFERLFRRVAELRDPNELRPLVIAFTTNVICDELRNRWIRRWLPVGQADPAPRTSSMPPDPASREPLRRLYFILDRFSTEDRIAFAFHFLQGLSLEEVALALDLSLPATQRVLARVWNRTVLFVERDIALLDYLSSLEGQGSVRMKSGVQMNFLERRLRADRALSQLTRMVHDATEDLSSREQRGVYQLESMLVEKSSMARPIVHTWVGSALAARWRAFSTIVLALVAFLWARVCVHSQSAFVRARVVWRFDLVPIFVALRAGLAGGVARLRRLRARERADREMF